MLLSGRVCTGLGKTLLVGWIKLALIVQYSLLLPSIARVTLVSVPLWLAVLSNQLWITDLVGRYPHQQSNQRRPVLRRKISFYGIKPNLRVGSFLLLTHTPCS